MSERAMIVVERLVKDFGDVRAVDDITLEIPAGEFFSMLGPSGCGKTTTLRVIAGFEEPDSGRVLLDGQDVTWVSPKKRNVNMVFQDYALFPHMTVAENVAFGLRLRRVDRSEINSRVAEMLQVVRLDGYEDRRPAALSGGQRQRVALARALVNRPAALLLDEPLGALDLKLRREMQLELKRIQQSTGTTFVYVTHDQEEALTMSDRIAVMDGGVVQQVDAPRALYERPDDRLRRRLHRHLQQPRAHRRRAAPTGSSCMELGEGMRIVAPDPGDGGDCQITVRPEKIRIGAESAASGSRVAGTVVEQVYLGSRLADRGRDRHRRAADRARAQRRRAALARARRERRTQLACAPQPRDRRGHRRGARRVRARVLVAAVALCGVLAGCGSDSGETSVAPAPKDPDAPATGHPALLRLRRHGHRRAPRPVPRAEPRRRPPDGELQLQQGGGGEARRRLRRRRGRDLRRRDGAAADPGADPAARPGGDRGLRPSRALELRRDPQRGGQGPLRPHLGRARTAWSSTPTRSTPSAIDSYQDLFDPAYAGRAAMESTPLTAIGGRRRWRSAWTTR